MNEGVNRKGNVDITSAVFKASQVQFGISRVIVKEWNGNAFIRRQAGASLYSRCLS